MKHRRQRHVEAKPEPVGDHPKHTARMDPRDAVILFVVVLIAFHPAFQAEFLNYDDHLNYLENPHFQGLGVANLKWMFTSFFMGHYQPVTWLTLGFDALIGNLFRNNPLHPLPYHLTNLLFHAASALLLMLILRRLFRAHVGTVNQSVLRLGSIAAALLFAVHPLRVESVLWITERRDVVSGFFLLLMLRAWLDHRDRNTGSVISRRAGHAFIMVHVWFLCGIMSKEILMMTPVFLVVMDYFPFRRIREGGSVGETIRGLLASIREKGILFAIAFVFGAIVTAGDHEQNWLMTLDAHPLPARLFQATYAAVFYIVRFVIPMDLLPIYEMRLPLDYLRWPFMVSMAVTVISILAAILLRRRVPLFATALAWHLLFLFPVSGIVQTGQQLVACRYSYIPAMILSVLVMYGILEFYRRAGQHSGVTRAVAGALTIWILILTAGTMRLGGHWRTSKQLWEYTISKTDGSTFAHNNLGQALLVEKQYAEAREQFERALAIESSNLEAQANLGLALERIGDTQGALSAYEAAIRGGPTMVPVRLSAGDLYLKAGRNAEAEAMYRSVLDEKPGLSSVRVNLGLSIARQNRYPDAIPHYREALQADPNLYQARYNLAIALNAIGRRDEAIAELKRVLASQPEHAGSIRKLDEWSKESLP